MADEGRLAGEATTTRRQTHSRHLMRLIDMALDMSGMAAGDIDVFAVTWGPGSFTGLRIGISTVKGLAAAAQKPVVGVSSLAALAFPVTAAGELVCALLDAGKGEVYSACYRFGHRPPAPGAGSTDDRTAADDPLSSERVWRPRELLAAIAHPCIFVGEGARVYAGMIASHLGGRCIVPPGDHHVIRASSVARLAFLELASGTADPRGEVLPRYIRKSDAELSLGQGSAGAASPAPV